MFQAESKAATSGRIVGVRRAIRRHRTGRLGRRPRAPADETTASRNAASFHSPQARTNACLTIVTRPSVRALEGTNYVTAPSSARRTSSCRCPFVLTASPPSMRDRPVPVGEPAAAFLKNRHERRAIPGVHHGIEHHVGAPGGDQAVPIAVAPPALEHETPAEARPIRCPSRRASRRPSE